MSSRVTRVEGQQPFPTGQLDGGFVNNDSVREIERASIRAFVARQTGLLQGDVLDYGCGLSPYRDLCGPGYVGYDRAAFPANVSGEDVGGHTSDWDPLALYDRLDAILCNQVIQYVPRPLAMLVSFRFALKPGGYLVLTGPTNWAEVEPEDLARYTLQGARTIVEDAGFNIVEAVRRATINLSGFELSLGWAILATKQ